jgi:ribose transport system permease protein
MSSAVGEPVGEASVEAGARFRISAVIRTQVQTIGVTVAVVALFLVTGLHSPYFWQVNNVRVLAMNMSFIALAGVGTAILIVSGNIDLSIGSILGLTAVLAGIFAKSMPAPLAFICATGVGGLVGAANGLLVWNVSASPIIITLGSMTLLRGLTYVVTRGESITGLPQSFVHFANTQPLSVPTPVWFAAGAVLLGFLFLTFTKTGRHIYAIGGNREASRAAGIRVRRLVIGAFVVNGLLVGLAGALQASLYSAPDQTFGVGFELQVITAVIVGGVSFAGGEGGVVRAIIGVALLEVVSGAIVAFNIDPNYANVLTGAILIFAVSIDQIVQKNRERFQKAMAMRDQARLHRERMGSTGDGSTSDPALAGTPAGDP